MKRAFWRAATVAYVAIAVSLFLTCPCLADDDGWRFFGEIGSVIDLQGEDFGAGTLFDARIDPDDSLEETVEELRFRDETTRTSGLLELGLENWGEDWLHLQGRLKTAPSRSHGDLDVRAGTSTRFGTLTLSEQLSGQGGKDDPGGGLLNSATASIMGKPFRGGLRFRFSTTHEISRAGKDSLSKIFDYHTLRPSFQLRKSLGWSGGVSLRLGQTRKRFDTVDGGAYDSNWLELDWSQYFSGGRQIGATIRAEGRGYTESDSLTPSYHENTLDMTAASKLFGPVRGRLDIDLRAIAYAIDSSVFRDHWRGGAAITFETDPTALFSEVASESESDLWLLAPRWTIGLGPKFAYLRNEGDAGADAYDAFSFLLGFSRDSSERFWFDLSGEIGRRNYLDSSDSQGIVFEGFNLSLAGTDYTFWMTSLIADIALPMKLRLELFGQYEDEAHTDSADDFRLWMLSISLARRF